MPRGSQVIPNHLSIPALKAGSGGGTVVNVTLALNINNRAASVEP